MPCCPAYFFVTKHDGRALLFAVAELLVLCQYELIYTVFGRSNFERTTANLDLFLRRFNEVQYWVVTEMCLAQSMSKRVQLLRKFIKIAA